MRSHATSRCFEIRTNWFTFAHPRITCTRTPKDRRRRRPRRGLETRCRSGRNNQRVLITAKGIASSYTLLIIIQFSANITLARIADMISSLFDIPRSIQLCGFCGDKPATINERWCSRHCQRYGEREIETAPTPDKIRERCAEIQAGWDKRTQLARRHQGTQLEIDESAAVRVQVVRVADMRA